MFPLMPYLNYGKMDREDIYDIIAYIRALAQLKVRTGICFRFSNESYY